MLLRYRLLQDDQFHSLLLFVEFVQLAALSRFFAFVFPVLFCFRFYLLCSYTIYSTSLSVFPYEK